MVYEHDNQPKGRLASLDMLDGTRWVAHADPEVPKLATLSEDTSAVIPRAASAAFDFLPGKQLPTAPQSPVLTSVNRWCLGWDRCDHDEHVMRSIPYSFSTPADETSIARDVISTHGLHGNVVMCPSAPESHRQQADLG